MEKLRAMLACVLLVRADASRKEFIFQAQHRLQLLSSSLCSIKSSAIFLSLCEPKDSSEAAGEERQSSRNKLLRQTLTPSLGLDQNKSGQEAERSR